MLLTIEARCIQRIHVYESVVLVQMIKRKKKSSDFMGNVRADDLSVTYVSQLRVPLSSPLGRSLLGTTCADEVTSVAEDGREMTHEEFTDLTRCSYIIRTRVCAYTHVDVIIPVFGDLGGHEREGVYNILSECVAFGT